MLSGYRFMWIVVMFDLPVVEKVRAKSSYGLSQRIA
jgi:CRISPR/Cas system-associated protein endoribonuclease Cas2